MKSIYILGSLNMDLTIYGDRFPEPGETLPGRSFRTGAGGKGLNQAVAAARLGGDVHFLGAIGNDALGAEMKDVLEKAGVDVRFVATRNDVSSGVAMIEVTPETNSIMLDLGANLTVKDSEVDAFLSGAREGDFLLAQGENNLSALARALSQGKGKGMVTIFNPAPADRAYAFLLHYVDILVPNEKEFALLSNRASLQEGRQALGVPTLIVTLGSEGSFISDLRGFRTQKAYEVDTIDTTGAGDAFVGSLGYFLADGAKMEEAVKMASAYAALQTTRKGTSVAMPSKDDFVRFFKTHRR